MSRDDAYKSCYTHIVQCQVLRYTTPGVHLDNYKLASFLCVTLEERISFCFHQKVIFIVHVLQWFSHKVNETSFQNSLYVFPYWETINQTLHYVIV